MFGAEDLHFGLWHRTCVRLWDFRPCRSMVIGFFFSRNAFYLASFFAVLFSSLCLFFQRSTWLFLTAFCHAFCTQNKNPCTCSGFAREKGKDQICRKLYGARLKGTDPYKVPQNWQKVNIRNTLFLVSFRENFSPSENNAGDHYFSRLVHLLDTLSRLDTKSRIKIPPSQKVPRCFAVISSSSKINSRKFRLRL